MQHSVCFVNPVPEAPGRADAMRECGSRPSLEWRTASVLQGTEPAPDG